MLCYFQLPQVGKQLTKYHNPSTTSFKRLLHQSKYACEELIVLLLCRSYTHMSYPLMFSFFCNFQPHLCQRSKFNNQLQTSRELVYLATTSKMSNSQTMPANIWFCFSTLWICKCNMFKRRRSNAMKFLHSNHPIKQTV